MSIEQTIDQLFKELIMPEQFQDTFKKLRNLTYRSEPTALILAKYMKNEHQDILVRQVAADIIGDTGNDSVVLDLLDLLDSNDEKLLYFAMQSLDQLVKSGMDETVSMKIGKSISKADFVSKFVAVNLLCRLHHKIGIEWIRKTSQVDCAPKYREFAMEVMVELDKNPDIPDIFKHMQELRDKKEQELLSKSRGNRQ